MATAGKSKLLDQTKEFLERNAIPNVSLELEKSLARKRVHQYCINDKSKQPIMDSTKLPSSAAHTAALLHATLRKPMIELNWDFRFDKNGTSPTTATNVQNGTKFLDVADSSSTSGVLNTENKASQDSTEKTHNSEATSNLHNSTESWSEDSTDMLFVSDLQKLVSFVLDYDPPRSRSAEIQALYATALANGTLRDMVTRPPSVARVRYPASLNAVIVVVLGGVSAYEAERFGSCFAALRERGHVQCDFASSFATQKRCFDSAFLYYEPSCGSSSNAGTANGFDSPSATSSSVANGTNDTSKSTSENISTKKFEPSLVTEYDREVESRFGAHRSRCHNAYDVRFVYSNVSSSTRSPFAHLDRVRRTSLLCSVEDLREDGYPLPFGGRFQNFSYSLQPDSSEIGADIHSAIRAPWANKWYVTPDDSSPLFAIDCEMCETTTDDSALVRVSVVDESLQCVYDTLVRPHETVTDYRTVYSGVSAEMLDPVAVRLADVRRDLAALLPPNAILCGHSLNFDLLSLRAFHPFVIDTSRLFARDSTFYYAVNGDWNATPQASHSKPSLRSLVARFLNDTIQSDSRGHSSIEDASATMRLVQLRLRHGITSHNAAGPDLSSSLSQSPLKIKPKGTEPQPPDVYCCPDCFCLQRGGSKPRKLALQNDFYEKLTKAIHCGRGLRSCVTGPLSSDALPLFYRPIRAVSACLIDEPGCSLDAFESRSSRLAVLHPEFRERTASWVVPDDAVASWSAIEHLKQLSEYQRWLEASNAYHSSTNENGSLNGSFNGGSPGGHSSANGGLGASATNDRSNFVYVHLHGFDAVLRSGRTDQQTLQERLSELVFTHLLRILNGAQSYQRNSLVLTVLPGRLVSEADVRAGIADQVARGRCYISIS